MNSIVLQDIMRPMHMRFISLLLVMSVVMPVATAQRQKNYIYLFDCTQSMQTLGLWDPARHALDKTIARQSGQDGSRFTVIPFQGTAHPAFTFDGSGYAGQKGEIAKKLDEYILTKTNTNIFDVFLAGMKACDPLRDNRVYLLTDGEDNVKGTDEVCKAIAEWCDKHQNTRFFYVTLDAKAANPKLDEALGHCSDAYAVKCHDGVIPQIADIGSMIHANTLELDRNHRLEFSEPETVPLTVACNDPCFDVEIEGGRASDYSIGIRFRIRDGLSLEALNDKLATMTDGDGIYSFRFEVKPLSTEFMIANPIVTVKMANTPQRRLDLLGGTTDETVIEPAVSWHPSFLWSDEKEQEIMDLDLSPVFNRFAGNRSAATFTVESADGNDDDFTVYFNGDKLAEDEAFAIVPGQKAHVGIMFDRDASTGERHFNIVSEGSRELEIINGLPAGEAEAFPFRMTYEREWNPLATVFFWIGVALLAALVAWFVLLKKMFFPTFGLSTLQFEGPDPYYARKRVRGARKVVLTSTRRSQSLLNRLFTGNVLYVSDEHWQPELVIIPEKRRRARIATGREWSANPTAKLSRGDTTTVISPSGAKTKITAE